VASCCRSLEAHDLAIDKTLWDVWGPLRSRPTVAIHVSRFDGNNLMPPCFAGLRFPVSLLRFPCSRIREIGQSSGPEWQFFRDRRGRRFRAAAKFRLKFPENREMAA
jgi:hypothetical protein